jgi:hypothetical protein
VWSSRAEHGVTAGSYASTLYLFLAVYIKQRMRRKATLSEELSTEDDKVIYLGKKKWLPYKERKLTQPTTWISLEDIMLSEIVQSQKDKYGTISFINVTQELQFVETERRIVVPRDVRKRGKGGKCVMGIRVLF